MSEHCAKCNLRIASQEDRVKKPDGTEYHISCWMVVNDNGNGLPAKMELKQTGEKGKKR